MKRAEKSFSAFLFVVICAGKCQVQERQSRLSRPKFVPPVSATLDLCKFDANFPPFCCPCYSASADALFMLMVCKFRVCFLLTRRFTVAFLLFLHWRRKKNSRKTKRLWNRPGAFHFHGWLIFLKKNSGLNAIWWDFFFTFFAPKTDVIWFRFSWCKLKWMKRYRLINMQMKLIA